MASGSFFDVLRVLSAGPEAALGMAALLEHTERLPGKELERQQLLRLERLLEHARTNVPFYAALPAAPRGGLGFERWRELPLLSRPDLRDRADELVSRRVPAEHRIVREVNSSGSTGRHVTVKIDAVSSAMRDALALRDHRWHGRDVTEKAAAIRAVISGAEAPHGRKEKRWSMHPRSGPLSVLDVHTPVRDQLDWLVREDPAYLSTYASNAAALVEEASHADVALPRLRELGTFGEALAPGLRDACQRVLGVPLVDAYSTVELGFVALECSDRDYYHVQSEHLLVEVLRDDGSLCQPGESGRVVATALHAFAMPLLRYEVGDYAVVGDECPCGRGLPVLERILGRSRNMLKLPSGDVLWPRYGSTEIGKLFPLRQFRLVQKSLHALELELAVTEPMTEDQERRLRAFVLETIAHPFELRFRYVDAISRAPSGKFEDFVCELEAVPVPAAHSQ